MGQAAAARDSAVGPAHPGPIPAATINEPIAHNIVINARRVIKPSVVAEVHDPRSRFRAAIV